MYLFSRHIDSARFNPMAFTRMRTCPGPASGTSTFLKLNTSGPPAFENSTTRDIVKPRVQLHLCKKNFLRPVGARERDFVSSRAYFQSMPVPYGTSSFALFRCRGWGRKPHRSRRGEAPYFAAFQ